MSSIKRRRFVSARGGCWMLTLFSQMGAARITTTKTWPGSANNLNRAVLLVRSVTFKGESLPAFLTTYVFGFTSWLNCISTVLSAGNVRSDRHPYFLNRFTKADIERAEKRVQAAFNALNNKLIATKATRSAWGVYS
jgi:hypothetical protein